MRERMESSQSLNQLVEDYFGLESMEVTEMLLDRCGATLDARVLPFLRMRLDEEQMQRCKLHTNGYIRMGEKSQQLIASLQGLIAAFQMSHETTREVVS